MIKVRYRGLDYEVARRPELVIGEIVPWCVVVDGASYQVGVSQAEAGRGARDFLHIGIRSDLTPRTPVFLASTRYPLLLSIDTVAIRAWPVRVDEGRWPVWFFESAAWPRSECGSITAEQTLEDVVDLAKLWLRSHIDN